MHAGPSITITSVTDGLSFFIGSMSDAAALSSFCFFCGLCVVMLYFSFLTIFSPWFLEDMQRMHNRKGDCFGLCCCKEDSFLCLKGKLLTNRQRSFSRLPIPDDAEEDRYSSKLEEYISEYIAKEILSDQGRAFIFLVWLVLICFSLIGASQL